MSTKIIQPLRLRCFVNALIKHLPGMILVVSNTLIQQANAQDLVLQDTTITTTATFSASNSITAGPNFTIASTGDVTLIAAAVALKPRFFIIKGGKLQVVSEVIAVNIKTDDPVIPDEFIVHQNFPNPFNPTTKIRYRLPNSEKVEIVVYNIFAQRVTTLISQDQVPGSHTVVWDGTSKTGETVSSGVYYYKVTAGKHSVVKKMAFLK